MGMGMRCGGYFCGDGNLWWEICGETDRANMGDEGTRWYGFVNCGWI